jgi:hypothetical protein
MAEPAKSFRIAMRTTEDGWWVALLARIETLDQAVEIGRIRRSTVRDERTRRLFIDTMKAALEAFLADHGIIPGMWQEQKPMEPSEGTA